ncbi:DUF1289 domain-containing protein [Franconibacter daqui]|uniref:DUF1289 domain-containing protein n=1 Tax=Franconibacter daqui TaxID=2047724 RepID=UPI00166647B0|nr:DUF1289 domain-containing protein [Franconibacter daqui]GGD14849.1 DUF1289 domain-containing protein [Franconibacter daqui]
MAEQLEFFPVPSPCRGICQSDERGFCRGCLRSRDERFNWQRMSDAQKQEVLRLCRQRLLRKLRAAKPEPPEEPQQPSLF